MVGGPNKDRLMMIEGLVSSELFHWDHMEELISPPKVGLRWQVQFK